MKLLRGELGTINLPFIGTIWIYDGGAVLAVELAVGKMTFVSAIFVLQGSFSWRIGMLIGMKRVE